MRLRRPRPSKNSRTSRTSRNSPPAPTNRQTRASRLRSVTPRAATRSSPPPAPRTPNNAPRSYAVTAYDGHTAAQLTSRANAFATMCDRPGYGVSPDYVRRTFAEHKGPPDSMLAVTVSAGRNVVAFAKCTLVNILPGAVASRILFIDLVCRSADEAHKGVGSVLLAELEAHALRLGAQFSMLQSVLDPSVMRAYYGAGFERGVGNRSIEFLVRPRTLFHKLARGRLGDARKLCDEGLVGVDPVDCRAQVAEQVKGYTKEKALRQFMDALLFEYYPPYNELHDRGSTVVMTKRLPRGRDIGAVDWQARYGVLRRPASYHLATYERLPTGRLVPVHRTDVAALHAAMAHNAARGLAPGWQASFHGGQ